MNLRNLFSLFFTITSVTVFSQNSTLPQLGKSSVKDIVNAMTLDEKIEMLHGTGMKYAPAGGAPVAGNVEGKVPGAAGNTYEIARLGIPSIVLADGPAGLRIDSIRYNDNNRYYATAFPIETSLASSWDTELVQNVGNAMGEEVHDYGVDVILGPAMNTQRNPLGGRNFEYYSEDPYIAGMMGTAMVNGVQSNGVGTSIKHFVGNEQESNRASIDDIISQRALREIYLKPFELTVRNANPWTIMSSYNKINGIYTSESYDLLTTILRDEWDYKGIVMTDWFAGRDYAAQVRAGNDLLMPGRTRETVKIKDALEDGTLTMADIDRNVEKILNIILKSPAFKNYKYSDSPDLSAHAKVARQAGSDGMVLLKNNGNVLPIKDKNVALLGNTSYDMFVGGTGSGEVYKAYSISLFQGLEEAGYNLDKTLETYYVDYITKTKAALPPRQSVLETVKPLPERSIDAAEAAYLAATDDVALITIGRNAGEGHEREIDGDYYFNDEELQLIKTISTSFHTKNKKVVVILNINGVVDVKQWRDMVDGILVAWQPGQEAGHSVADVISGAVNPSGHLAITFPMQYSDVPNVEIFPNKSDARPDKAIYNEGVYVGYRYYTTFNVKPAYEFGFGLSYTTFNVSKLKLYSKNFEGEMKVSVEVKNTGKVAGQQVVQLYLSAPAVSEDKPVEELKAFAKTKVLKPGEKQKITFVLQPSDLTSFVTKRSAWIADAGIYTVKIGTSCLDIKQTATFKLDNELVTEKVNNVLNPVEPLTEMKK